MVFLGITIFFAAELISFNPFPVSKTTHVSLESKIGFCLRKPAYAAAAAGSEKSPQAEESSFCADKISSSVTITHLPL